MAHPSTRIWLLRDGKPGHENQSLGLAEALARLQPCEILQIPLPTTGGWLAKIRAARHLTRTWAKPDLILAAGHSTHLTLCWLALQHRAKSVVLMKPSLPLACFDFCIAPAHDFPNGATHPKLLLTRGALNRVTPGTQEKSGNLLLIGGPSKTHGWDTHALIDQLALITADGTWELTDSRRTPADFLPLARTTLPNAQIFSHTQTPPTWVPDKLRLARQVWVTEDSVSMIYEALTSGANVGLLPAPRLKSHSRVIAGLDSLIADAYLTPFDLWKKTSVLPPPPTPLQEADRCAAWLVQSIK